MKPPRENRPQNSGSATTSGSPSGTSAWTVSRPGFQAVVSRTAEISSATQKPPKIRYTMPPLTPSHRSTLIANAAFHGTGLAVNWIGCALPMSMNQVIACHITRANSTRFTYRSGGVRRSWRNDVYADSPARSCRSRFRRMRPYTALITPPNSRSWKPRYRGFRNHHPARRFAGYGWAIASPRDRLRHEQTPHVARRREELERLNRGRRVDSLRAGDGALAHERALPHARLRVQARQPRVRPLVSRVPDVPQRERRGRRSDE